MMDLKFEDSLTKLDRVFDALISAMDRVTVAQARTHIKIIFYYGDDSRSHMTQEEIGDHLGVAQGMVSKAVKQLKVAGVVTKDTSATSERDKFIELTPKGRGLVTKIRNILEG